MYSFPTTRLPVEVLDNIVKLAIDVGTLTIKEVTLICPRWKMRYQATLFKSVTLDPFDAEIPDLEKRAHLAPWIKVIRVAHRSRSSTPPDSYERDIMEPFTKFLSHASKVQYMTFLDERIQWRWISPDTIDAFRAVFERPSFRSLEVCIKTSLPSWMLLHGASVASDLIIHSIGTIIPPESFELVSYQCSLTRLVLFGNSSVEQMAHFCLFHPYLAKPLLRNVVHATIQYLEVDPRQGRSVISQATMLVGLLGPQLEELELVAKSASRIAPPSYISPLEISKLKSLQRLNIHLVGCSATTTNTLGSAIEFMNSVFSGLRPRCSIKSFSLRVDDWRESYAGANNYQIGYSNLLSCIYHGQLSCRERWPLLTSSHVLVNIAGNELTESFDHDGDWPDEADLGFTSCLQVNVLDLDDFSGVVAPQMS